MKNGKLLVESSRKAAFLGFLTLIESTQHIFDQTVKNVDQRHNPPLKYVFCKNVMSALIIFISDIF
jgi:hypothetical protein